MAQDGKKHYIAEVIAQELEFMGSKPTTIESKPLSPQDKNFGQEVHPDEEIPF